MQEQVIKLCNQLSNTLSVVYLAPQCRLQLEITSQVNPVQCLLQVYERRAKMEDNQAVIYITRIIVIMIKVLFKDQAASSFCVLFLADLIRIGLSANIPILLLQRGYQSMLISALKHLHNSDSHISEAIDTSRNSSVMLLIQGLLRTIAHLLDNIDFTSTTIMRFHRLTLEQSKHSLTTSSPGIIYHEITGPLISATPYYADALLMDIPIERNFSRFLLTHPLQKDFIVILFDCSMELSISNDNIIIAMSSSLDSTHRSTEQVYMDALVEYLYNSHVTLVGCQKRIHPYLIRQLMLRGIVCIPRLSIRYISAMQNLSGARIHSTMPVLERVNHSSVVDP